MPRAHTTRQNLTDALVWLSETIVCALIFSAFAWFFLGGIIEDSGWRAVLLGVSVWLLGALCAAIDVRHRRRKHRARLLTTPAPTPDRSPAASDRPDGAARP
ncbi:MAG: hypothetical protein ACIAQF_10705 [Phycisphaerales bacterium JB065]